MKKLDEIKDYLPFILEEPTHSYIEWLINVVEEQQKELSLLCPNADMPVIESLKTEKLLMMERVKELEEKVEQLEDSLENTEQILEMYMDNI